MQLGLRIALAPKTATGGGSAPLSDFSGTIDTDGFRFDFVETAPTEFDPVSDPQILRVTRGAGGYDATGAAVTVTDDILITKRMRQRYPNEASLEASRAAVAQILYSGDTCADVTTNNSTRTVEKVLHAWIMQEDEVIDASEDLTVRWVASHVHGRNGSMVATSKVTISDGVTTLDSGEKSSMTGTYTSTVTGYSCPCYEHTFTAAQLATLSNGALTIDAYHKPWLGALWQASVDGAGATYPSAYADGPLQYTKVAAFTWFGVNPDGATGTPAGQATKALALSNAYATLQLAMAAAKASDLTGKRIVIATGTTANAVLNDELYNQTQTGGAIYISSAVSGTKVIMDDTGANDGTMLADHVIFEDIHFKKTAGGNYTQFSNRADLDGNMFTNSLGFRRCTIDANSNGQSTSYFANCGRVVFEDSSQTAYDAFDGDLACHIRAIGSSGMAGENFASHIVSQSVRSTGIFLKNQGGSSKTVKPDPCLFWFTELLGNNGNNCLNTDSLDIIHGVHVVGCLAEHTSSDAKVMFEIGTQYQNQKNNYMIAHCTLVGTELGMKFDNYGDGTVSSNGQIIVKNSVISGMEFKTDLDSKASPVGVPDGGRGAWEESAYLVNSGYFVALQTSAHQSGVATPDGEYRGLGSVWNDQTATNVAVVDDQSYGLGSGGNAGGGDYHINAGRSELPAIPAAFLMVNKDLDGNTLTAGSAIPGALQASS